MVIYASSVTAYRQARSLAPAEPAPANEKNAIARIIIIIMGSQLVERREQFTRPELQTTQDAGSEDYADFDGRKFSLALRVLRLGHGHLSTAPLTRKAQPIIEAAGRECDEIISVAVLDRTDVVFLARSETRRIVSARIGVGTRLPAYCTSAGRLLLGQRSDAALKTLLAAVPRTKFTPKTLTDVDELIASIAQARKEGYAISDEEFEIGLRSIAVAVPDSQGRVTVTMTASVQSARMTVEDMRASLLPILRTGATELSRLL
jgi:IclR family pca regulon transcriptional regulator